MTLYFVCTLFPLMWLVFRIFFLLSIPIFCREFSRHSGSLECTLYMYLLLCVMQAWESGLGQGEGRVRWIGKTQLIPYTLVLEVGRVDTSLALTDSQCITFYSLYGQYFDDNFLYCFNCEQRMLQSHRPWTAYSFILWEHTKCVFVSVIVCIVGLCHFFLALQVC